MFRHPSEYVGNVLFVTRTNGLCLLPSVQFLFKAVMLFFFFPTTIQLNKIWAKRPAGHPQPESVR